uniref:uncharacterized protein n=1 Tax=Lonchura striata TaxID=40157 RepID=UPI000B4D32BA|nr:uncharacterized protein LOC110481422 [Lonchura striata domestica]
MASTGSESSLCSPSAGNRDFCRDRSLGREGSARAAPRGGAGVAGVAGTHQELQEGFGVAEQRLGQVDDAVQVPTRVRGRGARAGGERQPRARPQPRPQPQQRQQRPPRSPCGTRTRQRPGGERNPPRRPPDTRDPPGTPPDTEGPPRTGWGGAERRGGRGGRRWPAPVLRLGGRRGAPGAHLGRGAGANREGAEPQRGYRERGRTRSGGTGSGAGPAAGVPGAGGHGDRSRTWSRAHLDLSRTWTGSTGSGTAPGPGVPGAESHLDREYREQGRTWTRSTAIGPEPGPGRTGNTRVVPAAGLHLDRVVPEPVPSGDRPRTGISALPTPIPHRHRSPNPQRRRGVRPQRGSRSRPDRAAPAPEPGPHLDQLSFLALIGLHPARRETLGQ